MEYGNDLLIYAVLPFSLQPFKKHVGGAKCLLCGKRRGHLASQRRICRCRSMLECAACDIDTWYDGMWQLVKGYSKITDKNDSQY